MKTRTIAFGVVAVTAILLLCIACASETGPNDPVHTPIPTPSPVQGPMPEDVSVIYLHHSTGSNIWGGGVPGALEDYNTDNTTNYGITELAFPSGVGTSYPWENYPYDYWNIWVNHPGPARTYELEPTLEELTLTYGVIVFKHCFPVSNIGEDSGTASVSSSSRQLQNYYLQYDALKTKMHDFPDTRFIVWTGAANVDNYTSPEDAARARTFFTWVRDTWDEDGDNIYVWDFFELETEGGNVLLDEYAQNGNDSHPTSAFSAVVAPYFVNRLVDVIQGRGDNGPVTGNYYN